MDQVKFSEAQGAYDAGDFRTAAKAFLAAAGKGSVGNGAAYHMAGNSLMRLRRHHDAVTVYGHALRDDTYDKRGSVLANLGAAFVCLGEYAKAADAYESALAEPDYPTPYKALQGMAAALMERGRVEEAAGAYRKAALDEGNPDPGKALVNLGLCFMALGRPLDAAEAYKAALGFDDYQGRGKALANLGQAYVAAGDFIEAVRAFEKATQLHGHKLSEPAQRDYDTAVEAVRPRHETVDGWETGDIAALPIDEEPGGWDTAELQALTGAAVVAEPTAEDAVWSPEPSGLGPEAEQAAAELGFGDESAVSDFFALTEEEMRARDREVRRADRADKRGGGSVARVIVTLLVVVILAVGAVAAAWWFGLGWPTQRATVNGMLTAYSAGEPVDQYWVAVPEKDVTREMAKIPPVKEFGIDDVDRGPETSSVSVTVTPDKGSPLRYNITLVREGVGWKVNGVENDWSSTDSP